MWYEGGPLIKTLPFPVKDENRPGHYKSSYVNIDDPKCVKSILKPPSTIIKQEFSKLNTYPPSETFIQQLARKVMLSPDNIKLWLDHLHTVLLNCKRGAAKAAVTRRAKKTCEAVTLPSVQAPPLLSNSSGLHSDQLFHYGQCEKRYNDETDEEDV